LIETEFRKAIIPCHLLPTGIPGLIEYPAIAESRGIHEDIKNIYKSGHSRFCCIFIACFYYPTYIHKKFVPRMKAAGVTDDQIKAMLAYKGRPPGSAGEAVKV